MICWNRIRRRWVRWRRQYRLRLKLNGRFVRQYSPSTAIYKRCSEQSRESVQWCAACNCNSTTNHRKSLAGSNVFYIIIGIVFQILWLGHRNSVLLHSCFQPFELINRQDFSNLHQSHATNNPNWTKVERKMGLGAVAWMECNDHAGCRTNKTKTLRY